MDDLIGNLVAGVPVAGVLGFFANRFWVELKALQAEVKRVNDEYIAFLKDMAKKQAGGDSNG